MTRIALVGCGRWGRLVLRDLTSLGCDVVVVGRSEATREAGPLAQLAACACWQSAVEGLLEHEYLTLKTQRSNLQLRLARAA